MKASFRISRILLLLVSVALSLASNKASADIRFWEDGGTPEAPARYLSLDLLLQPGFIWRQNDDNAPLKDDNFLLQRARLGLRAKIQDWLFARFELEATPTPSLQDAYLDLRFHQAAWLRLGQFRQGFLKTFEFGEGNIGFIDRTLYVPQGSDRDFLRYLSPRDVGAMATGKVGDLDGDAHSPVLQYWAGVFLGRGGNQTRNDDDAFLYAARLTLHIFGEPEGGDNESDLARNDFPRVAIGGGGYTNCDDRGNWNRGFTVDSEFRYKGLYALGTFVWFRNGATNGAGRALGYTTKKCNGTDPSTENDENIAMGASAQLQYALPQEWTNWGGWFANQTFELVSRFDYVSPNEPVGDNQRQVPNAFLNTDNPPTRYRLTFGANWFPTSVQGLRVSVNYQLNRETEDVVITEGKIVGLKNDVFWLQLTGSL